MREDLLHIAFLVLAAVKELTTNERNKICTEYRRS